LRWAQGALIYIKYNEDWFSHSKVNTGDTYTDTHIRTQAARRSHNPTFICIPFVTTNIKLSLKFNKRKRKIPINQLHSTQSSFGG
jgi:hypothetical protein